MKIVIDGEELDIPYKRIRVDALLEKAGLDPLKDRLVLVDASRHKMVEYCCLADVVEILDNMCFTTYKMNG